MKYPRFKLLDPRRRAGRTDLENERQTREIIERALKEYGFNFREADRRIRALEENSVFAAYGGMLNDAKPITPNIGQSFVTLPFTLVDPDVKDLVLDVNNDSMAFTYKGPYYMDAMLSFYHDSKNSGRNFTVRIWDTVDSLVVAEGVVGVGRNQEATNFTIIAQVYIDSAHIANPLVIQVGGTTAQDVITVDKWEQITWGARYVAPVTHTVGPDLTQATLKVF